VARTRAPYGSWESSIPIEVLGAGRVSLSATTFDSTDGSAAWIEGRPDEDGRQVLRRGQVWVCTHCGHQVPVSFEAWT